ncbi:MAG TPA: hypothetical protein VGL59_10245 [Polyangia bacterium]|jgi:hypothetical protein
MDESPEELEQIRAEAARIDVHQYRNRFRLFKAIGLGAFLAGVVWLILLMLDGRRNPCERVRDHFCRQDPKALACRTYEGVFQESMHDDSQAMRANIRSQCQSKIDRLKEEDGVSVR